MIGHLWCHVGHFWRLALDEACFQLPTPGRCTAGTTRPCPCPSSICRLSYAVVKNDHRRLLLVLSCAIFWYFHFCLVCLTFSTAFSPSGPCALAFRGRVPCRPYPIE